MAAFIVLGGQWKWPECCGKRIFAKANEHYEVPLV